MQPGRKVESFPFFFEALSRLLVQQCSFTAAVVSSCRPPVISRPVYKRLSRVRRCNSLSNETFPWVSRSLYFEEQRSGAQ